MVNVEQRMTQAYNTSTQPDEFTARLVYSKFQANLAYIMRPYFKK